MACHLATSLLLVDSANVNGSSLPHISSYRNQNRHKLIPMKNLPFFPNKFHFPFHNSPFDGEPRWQRHEERRRRSRIVPSNQLRSGQNGSSVMSRPSQWLGKSNKELFLVRQTNTEWNTKYNAVHDQPWAKSSQATHSFPFLPDYSLCQWELPQKLTST